ncbi:MAG: hypothetical protein M1832_002708 [Thelocarpon impressellum]|nr:MAG: hypothetical protein M1832_002708 [Thelocarpon impressellum]
MSLAAHGSRAGVVRMGRFDASAVAFLEDPLAVASAAPNSIAPSGPMVPMMHVDLPEQATSFEPDAFVGSDDGFGPPPFVPVQLKRFSSSYDDPFADATTSWEQAPAQEQSAAPESPTMARDNELLGFSRPIYNYGLLDFSGRRVALSMSAQLHGMFFLAESPWAAAGESARPSTELTCYRRNLFQISGSITLPRAMRFLLTEQGDRIPIISQELTVSATESVEGNPVKLISVPWKTPVSATTTPVEDKTEKEPPSIGLDLMSNADVDADYASFPLAWKRLQFRIATANNGRRKELQQHFVVRLKVVATLATGATIAVCEAQSGAIIVRGRSPRNFKSGKDLPLSGSASSSRRMAPHAAPVAVLRTPTATAESSAQDAGVETARSPDLPTPQFKYEQSDLHLSPGFLDWMNMAEVPPGALTAVPDVAVHDIGDASAGYAKSNPETSHPASSSHQSAPSGPIHLSLTDEESPRKRPATVRADSGSRSAKVPRLATMPPRASDPSTTTMRLAGLSSPDPDESADLLYEYFPLGLDDWMAPVDAVYRPHVVHHTSPAPDPKAAASKARSKRYFSREE